MALRKLSQEPYLDKETVKNGDFVTVVEEPVIISAEQTKWGKAQGQVKVKQPNGEVRRWTMNNTTFDRCIDAFGASPSGWVGKKIRIEVLSQPVRGETKQVYYGHPVTEAENKKAGQLEF